MKQFLETNGVNTSNYSYDTYAAFLTNINNIFNDYNNVYFGITTCNSLLIVNDDIQILWNPTNLVLTLSLNGYDVALEPLGRYSSTVSQLNRLYFNKYIEKQKDLIIHNAYDMLHLEYVGIPEDKFWDDNSIVPDLIKKFRNKTNAVEFGNNAAAITMINEIDLIESIFDSGANRILNSMYETSKWKIVNYDEYQRQYIVESIDYPDMPIGLGAQFLGEFTTTYRTQGCKQVRDNTYIFRPINYLHRELPKRLLPNSISSIIEIFNTENV